MCTLKCGTLPAGLGCFQHSTDRMHLSWASVMPAGQLLPVPRSVFTSALSLFEVSPHPETCFCASFLHLYHVFRIDALSFLVYHLIQLMVIFLFTLVISLQERSFWGKRSLRQFWVFHSHVLFMLTSVLAAVVVHTILPRVRCAGTPTNNITLP